MNTPQQVSENELKGWYTYANEVVGTLAIGFTVTSLQFTKYSAEVATVLFLFLFLMYAMLAYKKRIRFHQDRMARYKGKWSVLFEAGFGAIFFLIGMLSLSGVAMGYDLSVIEGFSLKNFIDWLPSYLFT
ncbi:hypothetical protein ERW51_18250 [Aliivibrio finisterrensis]|uniref:hypothetical protein n=1 Tax=Aliivibrio finisterrensis TaxID=511998 RepID=UPI00101EAF0C|nr:hypothetical protein [Aliivibrio finisterrensis]RYU63765.1 hypothetical protein ERW54_18800 [Aliivibrio finisterrensis]RYU67061.1 hypothetical protein ERW51_18250 [Aliivibrio finisterrensis]RYU69718.1 hypothetical protein ERW48_18830 [Aliivibrio finisterrensis]